MSERPVVGNAAHGGRKPCSRFRFYNLGYFFSLSGLMALCEIILGMAIYALLWDSANELDKFLVTVAFLQWMTGLYIHATIAFCATGARIRGLLLYLLHHGVGAILYLGGAVTTLVSSMYTQTDDIIRTSLALGASALHLIQATRYLLKHRPGSEGADAAADEATCGFVVETRIAKFKSRPPPVPPVPVRIDSSVLQTRRDSSAVASVTTRRESTAVPSRRESSVTYPEYL
ncbi:uncharacterized protein LOC119177316 isoform X3 [Rhipicephalus microplus]|uniref:uncharacterized protein LOC119177316 isoform X3 n=1 Tax=Rhipicephalus microplus TaxID=6941 RepID=UPI003F6A9EFA